MKQSILIAAALLFAGFVGGLASRELDLPRKTIEANCFRLVDANGEGQAILTADPNTGRPGLVFRNSNGLGMILRIDEDGHSVIQMMDDAGKERISVRAGSDGGAICWRAQEDGPALMVGMMKLGRKSSRPLILMSNGRKSPTFMAQTTDTGILIEITDANEIEIFRIVCSDEVSALTIGPKRDQIMLSHSPQTGPQLMIHPKAGSFWGAP